MPSVISGDANVSATEFGYLDGVTSALQTQMDAKLPLAGGKILQIVRATDGTDRTTTSATMVDANISVSITPNRTDSVVILIWTASLQALTWYGRTQITDSSNNAISGAELAQLGNDDGAQHTDYFTLVGYATPATTSSVTYKGRFLARTGSTIKLLNTATTGQMLAIEVSA